MTRCFRRAIPMLFACICTISALAACASSGGQAPTTLPSFVSQCSAQSMPALTSTLPLSGLTIYAGSPTGNLYAFNAATGARRWCHHIATASKLPTVAPGRHAPPPPPDGVSTPTVVNGVVYVCADNGLAYAFSASTGSLRWSTQTGCTAGAPPTVADEVVYIDSSQGGIAALDASDSAMRCRSSQGGGGYTSVTINGGVIYTCAYHAKTVSALNASDGSLLWKYAAMDDLQTPPAVANGTVYIGTLEYIGESQTTPHTFALSASDGTPIWHATIGPIIDQAAPIVVQGILYIASQSATLYALNATTGVLLWRAQTGSLGPSMPIFANGALYVTSDGVYALEAKEGTLLWHNPLDYDPSMGFLAPTMTSAGLLIQQENGSDQVTFYLLNPVDGSVRGRMQTGLELSAVTLAP